MNNSPLNIPAMLRDYGLSPKKSLGQNFLIDTDVLERIVKSAEAPPDCSVLEVGPGTGSLTRYLAGAVRRVVAVELDARMIPLMKKVLGTATNVEIVHGDILKLNPAELMGEDGYLVVANIPYYITSNLIRHLLEASVRPSRMVLTIQREVAERITAKAGDMSLLALSVQLYGLPRIVDHIPAAAFYPAPDVDSAVVRIDLFAEPVIPQARMDDFFRLAKAGFGQKRKTLRNALGSGLTIGGDRAGQILQSAGIDPMRRAETLSLAEWNLLIEAEASSRVKSEGNN